MASNEMFAGIALQRLALGVLGVVLAVAWTLLFWPTVLPALESLAGAQDIPVDARAVAEAGPAVALRFSAAALVTMVLPVLAHVGGVVWFRSASAGLPPGTLRVHMTVFLAAGLATLGTFGPGLVSLTFGDGSPAAAYLDIASEHVGVPANRVLAMVLCAGGTTAVLLAIVLVIALFTVPSSRDAPRERRFSRVGWLVLPVLVATVAGLAVGLFVPMPA